MRSGGDAGTAIHTSVPFGVASGHRERVHLQGKARRAHESPQFAEVRMRWRPRSNTPAAWRGKHYGAVLRSRSTRRQAARKQPTADRQRRRWRCVIGAPPDHRRWVAARGSRRSATPAIGRSKSRPASARTSCAHAPRGGGLFRPTATYVRREQYRRRLRGGARTNGARIDRPGLNRVSLAETANILFKVGPR